MGGFRVIASNGELIEEALKVIRKFLPTARVIVFGSRARGDFRENSDLDVAIDSGEVIPAEVMERIREALDELPTLVTFDVVDLNAVSKSFREEILKTGRVVYDGKVFKETTGEF
jgi:predicted nucleotidyltransferase